ncbi:Bro-N domain-containing protein [Loigolactobacillus coryniformis subsp. coryniformis]|uniref:BRO-N domain-containing protein n=1 Tax=Loigolactobacillus coryniformis TaxID=1610 RepID=UPI0039941DDB
MEELQNFNFQGNQVRTVIVDDEPYFVGKDVADILGYAKSRNAISSHVDNEDKKDAPIQGPLGGTQNMTIISESGVYSLIFGSHLESAKLFKRWVTSEVLPTTEARKYFATD